MRAPRPIPLALPLYASVVVIATCGLVYELLAGALASYLLGESVTHFSLIIGLYLSAMGAGAWLSKHVAERMVRVFLEVELGVALVGGISAPLLFFSFGAGAAFPILLAVLVAVIGVLVGLEIPLLMRILAGELRFEKLVARILALDYIGALLAAVAFPLLLAPRMGLLGTSFFCGFANAAVSVLGTIVLRPLLTSSMTGLRVRGVMLMGLFAAGFVAAQTMTELGESRLFSGKIVHAKSSPYQRIVITTGKSGFQLFLNGHLQFSSADEYRYHESLVHPAMMSTAAPRRVLILGGGDGLAAREVLRHPGVEEVTLVDLDPEMTGLAAYYPPLAELSGRALEDPRVKVINTDAFVWLSDGAQGVYDVAIVDFPDPSTYALSKLYTRHFYQLLARRLSPDAAVAVQSSSPLWAPKSFWCVIRTMEAAGFAVRPYSANVPSFGLWGFSLAKKQPFPIPTRAPAGLRFLSDEALRALFVMPLDLAPVPVEINSLNSQILVRYHASEWGERE